MKRSYAKAPFVLALAAASGLAACTPPAPIENRAVGFESYSEYQRRREAELMAGTRQTIAGPGQGYAPYAPSTGPMGAPLPEGQAGGPIASGPITAGPIGTTTPYAAPAYPAPAYPATAQPAPMPPAAGAAVPPETGIAHAGISDEQDFSAVAARETIESDAQRIEANRAQYVQIQPGALPEREGNGPSPIIEYAINAPNRLGQSVYNRSGLSLSSSEKACARYNSPAAAQEAFLKAGGPKRDPKNLDPDGDGFACTWDPTPFQKVRG